MFRCNLFPIEKGEERVDIYYSQMTPVVKQIVSLAANEKPVIYGVLDEEKVLLDLKEIYYFEAVDRKVFAYTQGCVYQVSNTLTVLEQDLEEYGFVRISKAGLVNIYALKRIRPEPNMRISAVLKNGEKLQINRGYKRSFEDYLKRVRNSI